MTLGRFQAAVPPPYRGHMAAATAVWRRHRRLKLTLTNHLTTHCFPPSSFRGVPDQVRKPMLALYARSGVMLRAYYVGAVKSNAAVRRFLFCVCVLFVLRALMFSVCLRSHTKKQFADVPIFCVVSSKEKDAMGDVKFNKEFRIEASLGTDQELDFRLFEDNKNTSPGAVVAGAVVALSNLVKNERKLMSFPLLTARGNHANNRKAFLDLIATPLKMTVTLQITVACKSTLNSMPQPLDLFNHLIPQSLHRTPLPL